MSDAAAHIQAAQHARAAGDYYNAAVQQRRAITLLRGGDSLALGHALRHLAEILIEAGALEEADGPVRELLALYRPHGGVPPLEHANALRCAALYAAATGDDETALAFWGEARTRYLALNVAAGVAEADTRIAALRR